jgi:outer membrane protein TolC
MNAIKKSSDLIYFAAVFALLAFFGGGSAWGSEVPLSLQDYLHEVRTGNQAFEGSVQFKAGSEGRLREPELLTEPSLFSTFQNESDSKLPVLPSFTYDHVTTDNLTLGVSEQFSFGLKARVYYAYDYTNYVNASIPGVTGLDPSLFTPRDARPVAELSIQVWGGGFGSTVRATQESQEFQARSDFANSEGQLRQILVQAESAYWQLATSRDIVTIEEKALTDAQATYDYNNRKVKMNLAESSDVLQSEAARESAKLSLKTARDNERTAERTFNLVRNASVDAVPEPLEPVNWDAVESTEVPKLRTGNRADVDQTAAQARATEATARVQEENDRPTLELYGSYASNGRSYTGLQNAMSNSFDSGKPTDLVGIRFNMPLDFSAQNAARDGARKQAEGADLRFRQTVTDQENQWSDLVNRLSDAQSQYHYARIIENVQNKKLENEQKQLRRGRSTTFQVLQFETDYTNAQLARAKAGAQTLDLRAQLKLYESSEQAERSRL